MGTSGGVVVVDRGQRGVAWTRHAPMVPHRPTGPVGGGRVSHFDKLELARC